MSMAIKSIIFTDVLRYVRGTVEFDVLFEADEVAGLRGYSDSDWGGSVADMKSTTGNLFSFGNGVFRWCSRKQ